MKQSSENYLRLKEIRRWFGTTLGRHTLASEQALLDHLLPGYFGYHLLGLTTADGADGESLLASSPINQKAVMGLMPGDTGGFLGQVDQLPFSDDVLDVVLLHHVLEFLKNPQAALREIVRTSLPSGHLVVVGFNPHSSWGIWRQAARFRGRAPWTGAFIRPGRLLDWLTLLNFRIERADYMNYRLPVARLAGEPRRDYSQGISRYANWPFGAIYVIVARKQVGMLTPIRPVWKQRSAFGPLTVVRPTGASANTANRDIAYNPGPGKPAPDE